MTVHAVSPLDLRFLSARRRRWKNAGRGGRLGCRTSTFGVSVHFLLRENHDLGEGHYRCYGFDDSEDWLTKLAGEYVGLRTACNFEPAAVQVDGIEVLDSAAVMKRLRAATIPPRVGGNFDAVRSDLGETLSYLALETLYGTSIGYKSVRDRELVRLPGRGIDAVGVENGELLVLCLCETKVSNAAASPPGVVDSAGDSMRHQHRGHLQEHEATVGKIWDLARRCRDPEQQRLFMTGAMLLEDRRFDRLRLIACCVLVRPEDKYRVTDFGSFRRAPADYDPARVRFLVLGLPGNLDEVVDAFHHAALRGGEAA